MPGGSGPHDAVFRRVLGKPENAASQLRAVLPAGVVARLDLGRLARVSGSFVDANLRLRYSDLLFTAPLAGREAFVYVLVEHQSGTDPLMPFRILQYVVRIWDHYLAEHPQAVRLPAVIPLVVHHNRRPWDGPTDVWELVDLDPVTADAARECLPRLRFVLDDLAVVDGQALRARPLTPPARMTLLLLKIAAGNPGLVDELERWVDDLRAVLERPGGTEDMTALLTYVTNVGEALTDQRLRRLGNLVAKLGPEAEEAYVTIAEMLKARGWAEGEAHGRAEGEAHGRAEGEAHGRAEGEAHGRAEGEAHGRAEALVQLLTLKFGPLPPAVLDAVQAASVDQLETWTGRVLAAGTLDEILR